MHADNNANRLEFQGFVFDFERAELRAASGERIALRPQVLAVLQCLARRPGFTIAKAELMRCVWPNVVVGDDSLVQCIRELRHALHDHSRRIVQTEARRGYRLMAAAMASGTQTNPPEPPKRFDAPPPRVSPGHPLRHHDRRRSHRLREQRRRPAARTHRPLADASRLGLAQRHPGAADSGTVETPSSASLRRPRLRPVGLGRHASLARSGR